ncbi:hypothetical protein MRY82_10625 [bacterium]|nr:hypothetical protein [bacterium]
MKSKFRLMLSLVLALLALACHKQSVKQQQKQKTQAELEPETEVTHSVQEGYFSYMADANMFVSCDKKHKASILMQGKAYLELEKKYLALQVSPQKVYLKMRTTLVNRKTEQEELNKPAWQMDALLELNQHKQCSDQTDLK